MYIRFLLFFLNLFLLGFSNVYACDLSPLKKIEIIQKTPYFLKSIKCSTSGNGTYSYEIGVGPKAFEKKIKLLKKALLDSGVMFTKFSVGKNGDIKWEINNKKFLKLNPSKLNHKRSLASLDVNNEPGSKIKNKRSFSTSSTLGLHTSYLFSNLAVIDKANSSQGNFYSPKSYKVGFEWVLKHGFFFYETHASLTSYNFDQGQSVKVLNNKISTSTFSGKVLYGERFKLGVGLGFSESLFMSTSGTNFKIEKLPLGKASVFMGGNILSSHLWRLDFMFKGSFIQGGKKEGLEALSGREFGAKIAAERKFKKIRFYNELGFNKRIQETSKVNQTENQMSFSIGIRFDF